MQDNLDDALKLVFERNHFYKKKFYATLGVWLVALIIIAILIFIIVYSYKNQAKPYYFVADQMGRLVRDIPLSQQNMSKDALMAWTVEAVESANSFDFVNFRRQLQSAQKYFTDTGWATYMKELTISDNLLALQTRKWVFDAKVVQQPTLLTEGVLGTVRAWKFQMPMLVSYYKPPLYDEASKTFNPYVVTVIVVRQNMLQSYKGLAIYSMVIAAAPEAPKKVLMPAG